MTDIIEADDEFNEYEAVGTGPDDGDEYGWDDFQDWAGDNGVDTGPDDHWADVEPSWETWKAGFIAGKISTKEVEE